MIKKPKRPTKINNQDNKQPQNIEQLIRRYDLDNTKVYDFLDELAVTLNETQTIVSATEPTGDNRGQVWIQKGKNLINKSKLQNVFMAVNSTSEILPHEVAAYVTEWIPCVPNTQYTISGGNRKRWQTKSEDGTITYIGESMVITTNNTAKYLRCYCYYNDNYQTEPFPTIPDIQLEQNAKPTLYKSFIEPKIYVKNDNGVYEEFINAVNIPTIKKLSVSEFFDSTFYTIGDFEVYQYGKMINIQRMIVQNVGNLSGETNVGVINSKYLPSGNNTMRTLASSGGNAIDHICFVNSKNEDGNTIRLYKATQNAPASVNVYLFNISYLID